MTRDEFLQHLAESKLVDRDRLAVAQSETAEDPTGLAAARRCVARGWLTAWQAQQVLAGRTRLFLGRYKLLNALGQGGMGAVFQAEQTALRRVVALKVIAPHVLFDAAAVSRFLREIRNVAALRHPNIVEAYDADCVGQTYFLVMEYVPGRDLKAWIREHGRLPVGQACEIARQAAEGLQHAHEHGLVHRDVKPANLLIVPPADPATGDALKVKLLDLGLARFTNDTHGDATLTQSGQIMGTPDYIAPEQAENTRFADIRADVYSLGCTLFEMLTGRTPFSGETAMQKILARMRSEPPRVAAFRPEVPRELDALVVRMMARDPAARPATPAEAGRALEPFAQSTDPPTLQTTVWMPGPGATPALQTDSGDTTLDPYQTALTDHAIETPAATPFALAFDATPSATPSTGSVRRKAMPVPVAAMVGALALFVLVACGVWWVDRSSSGGRPSGPDASTPTPQPAKRPADATSPAVTPNVAVPTRADDRRVAAWAMSKGGVVNVRLASGTLEFKAPAALPKEKFQLVGVAFGRSASLYPSDMPTLNHLADLESLTIREIPLSRKPLAALDDLPSLKTLDLRTVGLADEGLPRIAEYGRLEHLTLVSDQVTDEGLAALAPLTNLKVLILNAARVRGPGWAHFKNNSGLTEISLGARKPESLDSLKSLRNLSSVALPHSVPDDLLTVLPELPNLTFLMLATSDTTDAGLEHVANCSKLKTLQLLGQQYSADALSALRRKLPECQIVHNGVELKPK